MDRILKYFPGHKCQFSHKLAHFFSFFYSFAVRVAGEGKREEKGKEGAVLSGWELEHQDQK